MFACVSVCVCVAAQGEHKSESIKYSASKQWTCALITHPHTHICCWISHSQIRPPEHNWRRTTTTTKKKKKRGTQTHNDCTKIRVRGLCERLLTLWGTFDPSHSAAINNRTERLNTRIFVHQNDVWPSPYMLHLIYAICFCLCLSAWHAAHEAHFVL